MRIEKGISQKEMAERLHKSPSAYNRIEAGEVKLNAEELPDIIQALDCSLDEFFKDATTINIQHNTNSQNPDLSHIQNVYNESEKLFLQFQGLMESLTKQVENSEKRSQELMAALLKKFNG